MSDLFPPVDRERWHDFASSGGRATLTEDGYYEPSLVIYQDNDGMFLAIGIAKIAGKLVRECREEGLDPNALALSVSRNLQFDEFTYSTCLAAIQRAREN